MTDRIYLMQTDGSLRTMTEASYAREDLLQDLLEQYPDLLAGEQMDGAEPRKWLLVSREYGVPDETDGGDRWAVDHLFLDQDAIPTLVEVKRSTDTRIRREVVGQMLDYAANAVVYWPLERIRTSLEARCERDGVDAAVAVAGLLRVEADDKAALDAFWLKVRTNLQAGRVRVVFVADAIPPELRRVVEFLNGQMEPAEVLAVEVRQFVGGGLKTLVPKVVGQTAAAQQKKTVARSSDGPGWTEERFFQELDSKHGPDVANVAREILDWIRPRVTRVVWGRGNQYGSMVPVTELHGGRERGGQNLHVFALWTYGSVEVYFQWLKGKLGFTKDADRRALLGRLNAIDGVSLRDDAIAARPTFPIAALTNPKAFAEFKAAVEWAIERATVSAKG
ncbi:MAG TPA: hypothetical protein VKU41_10040 [Polyangiaceae bacterium]|nr:hypothetical protein [Polyangiaceae bacterium]